MTPSLRLALDLHAVGPQRPAEAPALWLAVNMASALAEEPVAEEGEAALEALLPWNIIGATTPFRLIAPTGTSGYDVTIAAALPDADPFGGELPTRILELGQTLLRERKLFLAWSREPGQGAGTHVDEGDELDAAGVSRPDGEDETLPRPWLGLSSSLASLPGLLSQSLRGRVLIKIEGANLASLRAQAGQGNIRELILAPDSVRDHRNDTEFRFEKSEIQIASEAEFRRVTLTYRDPAGVAPDVLAYTFALPVRFLLPDGGPRPNGNYWLEASDSRIDTLADVDRIILEIGDPLRLASLLSPELLGSFLFNQPEDRSALPREIEDVGKAARDWAAGLAEDARDAVARDLYARTAAQFESGGGAAIARQVAKDAARWWAENFSNLPAPANTDDLVLSADGLDVAFEKVLSPLFKIGAQSGPVLPGEGIDFVVGQPDDRLLAEHVTPAQAREDLNEVAEYGMLVCRASPGHGLAPWRAVTAGLPVLDPERTLLANPWGSPATQNLPVLEVLTARGMALAFKDGILRNDDTYFGQLMIGPSALSHLHRENQNQQTQGDPLGDLSLVEFVAAGPLGKPELAAGLAPPLRYGDEYGLLPFVIDRAGGMPVEIVKDDRPWLLDVDKLSDPRGAAFMLHFLRRVPVGDLNLQPWKSQDGARVTGAWPALPAGVSLRASEWWAAQKKESGGSDNEPAPVVLLNAGYAGTTLPASIEFSVEPPSIDEFTLQRWCLPATNEDPVVARDQVDELKAEYARIVTARAALLEDEANGVLTDDPARIASLLPHDPSVWGLEYRVRRFGPDGNPMAALPGDTDVVRFELLENEKFLKQSVLFSWSSDTPVPDLPEGAIRIGNLEEGQFGIIEIDMLVPAKDGDRYDRPALDYTLTPDLLEVRGEQLFFYRHSGPVILAEALTKRLPDSAALHRAFQLKPDEAGRVVASIHDTGLADLQFLDSFQIERQRWIWRNLPIVPDGGSDDDDSRRLCSGLPLDLALENQEARDNSLATLKFDAQAMLDGGFVMRSMAKGRWPRGPHGRVEGKAVLLIDDRDGQAAADYLRYNLTAVSRYAGVFADHKVLAEPEESAGLPDPSYAKVRGPWRRVATRYRGNDDLRPLNILAVLPLTARPRLNPLTGKAAEEAAEGSTPFLVILDEIWFREYGPGEALRAEFALEEREIGDFEEGDAARRPLRYGPMPHKHLEPRELPGLVFTDEEAEQADELALTCFGPFGFSLDRSGNEALANATAFVVYIPDTWKIGPQWSIAVCFRRVLYGLTSAPGLASSREVRGPHSGAYLLYTLPDSRRLAKVGANGLAWIDRTASAGPKLTARGIDFELVPYVREGTAAASEVQNQYRYLLLVGPAGLDGGRGVEVFLPEKGFWLRDQHVADLGAASSVELPAGGKLRAQILEIELSGSFERPATGGNATDDSKVDLAISLQELFRTLLLPEPHTKSQKHDEDAPGRVVRVSDVFDLSRDAPL